jgi:hypothetical protein
LFYGSLGTIAPAQAGTRYETGIATGATLASMNEADLIQRLGNIKSLGATWIRVDFRWPAIQPNNPNQYKWGSYDRVVRQATAHGLKILAVLDYTPSWAREPRCAALATSEKAAQKCNPRSSADFARFVRTTALRYKHKDIRAWEIWNEPNLSGYWKTAQSGNTVFVDPQRYANLANAAAAQIRRNDPDSVIITGGLAPLFEPQQSKGMRQSDYLAEVLPHLKSHLFDGVGIHPYTWPVLPGKAAVYNAFYTVNNGKPAYNLRTIMAAAGWGNKQVWGTEYGASTTGLRSPTQPPSAINRPDHVTEATQAKIIQQGIEDWYTKPNVGPLFVHADSDRWLPKEKNEGGFGLQRSNGTKKPAYRAFQTATRQLQRQTPQ